MHVTRSENIDKLVHIVIFIHFQKPRLFNAVGFWNFNFMSFFTTKLLLIWLYLWFIWLTQQIFRFYISFDKLFFFVIFCWFPFLFFLLEITVARTILMKIRIMEVGRTVKILIIHFTIIILSEQMLIFFMIFRLEWQLLVFDVNVILDVIFRHFFMTLLRLMFILIWSVHRLLYRDLLVKLIMVSFLGFLLLAALSEFCNHLKPFLLQMKYYFFAWLFRKMSVWRKLILFLEFLFAFFPWKLNQQLFDLVSKLFGLSFKMKLFIIFPLAFRKEQDFIEHLVFERFYKSFFTLHILYVLVDFAHAPPQNWIKMVFDAVVSSASQTRSYCRPLIPKFIMGVK